MGKKKRSHPDVEELLSRPWCYYCERDFEDLKLLISHQKAKHFKCDRCGKRLNTAGGLSVHMNQVHKENLTSVENAMPNRQGLEIEIFGMEGVPEEVMAQHNQRIISTFYHEQAERRLVTGNPPRGQGGPAKKIKVESIADIKKRLAEYRVKRGAQKAAGLNGSAVPTDGQSPASNTAPFAAPAGGAFPYPPANVSGAPSFTPSQPFPPSFPPAASPVPGAPGNMSGLPARPPSTNAAPPTSNLPQRPPYGGPGYNGAGAGASTVDELVSSAAARGDDIDKLIRMAEAGIKPPKAGEEGAAAGEKKSKKDKDKNIRMVYADSDISPEEKMAMLPRYAVAPELLA